jgi:hypothetical protein
MVTEKSSFARFSLDLYLGDSNHIGGSLAKLLCDLENVPASLSGVLFENLGSTCLFDVLLKEKEVCVEALDTSITLIPS